jgi:Domain of unknown function (DUF1929)
MRITRALPRGILCLLALTAGGTAWAQESEVDNPTTAAAIVATGVGGEGNTPSLIDYGIGPGVFRAMPPSTPAAVPPATPTASIIGVFGPPVTWPIIGLHMILLPDGRVLNYGSDQAGQQGAQFIYDVWNPALGTGANSHLTLPNTTAVDLFCSAQQLLWMNGDVLLTGGDLTISGKRNFSNNNLEIFTPGSNTLSQLNPMQYPRWYPTMVPMPSGEMLVLGGRTSFKTATTQPELYNPATGWRTLPGAASDLAFGIAARHYYYPRAFVNPSGNVFVINADGKMYTVSTAGSGSIIKAPQLAPLSSYPMPTLMYAPNKLISIRLGPTPIEVDISGFFPKLTPVPGMSQNRYWSSGTVMADGRVVFTGGSAVQNVQQGVANAAELWNPADGAWGLAASATIPRLYHSNALLLPDATVVTLGGGAPGPVRELNAEIYYPPYLYAANGQPAVRPTFALDQPFVHAGGSLVGFVGPGDTVSRVTMVRAGSATHSTNLDQRLVSLPFNQTGQLVGASLPAGALTLTPGYYMVFVFNAAGVPAIANIILLIP